jgi:hypothetical protein
MLMRYHWGLGIGHTYCDDRVEHSIAPEADQYEHDDVDNSLEGDCPPDNQHTHADLGDAGMEGDDFEDPELGLEERDRDPELDDDGSTDSSSEDDLNDRSNVDDEVDYEELELMDTYES